MLNNYRVKAWSDPPTGEIHLIIWCSEGGREFVALPIELKFKEHQVAEREEPTLILPRFMADDFLRALAEGLDEMGIKTDQDAKLAGTLDATRYHLEDMRRLAFKGVKG